MEADSIAIGFADNTFIYLSRDFARFKEISDEAMRIVQSRGTGERCFFDDEVEAAKYGQKYLQLSFDQPINVQDNDITAVLILFTEREEFRILGNVLVKVARPDYSGPLWTGVGKLDTNRLEGLVDKLR